MFCCATILRGAIRFRIIIRPDVYIVVGHHPQEPNVYYIQLLNSSKPGQLKVVNRCQLYDLKRSVPPSISPMGDDGFASIPSFFNRQQRNFLSNVGDVNNQSDLQSHHYSTHSKHKTATTVNAGGGGDNSYTSLNG